MVQYRIFKHSASITINHQNFPIGSEHPQYEEILKLAKANEADKLLALLVHEEFKPLGLELKEGVLYYKNIALPHFFYNRFLKVTKKEEVIPYVNAWFNLEKRLSLLDQKRFGVYIRDRLLLWDKSGAEFIYYASEPAFSDPCFYNISSSLVFEEIIKNHSTITSYIKSLWPQANDAVLNILKEICLQDSSLNLTFIRVGNIFQNFSPEELEATIKPIQEKIKKRNSFTNASKLAEKLTKFQIQKYALDLLTNQKLTGDFEVLVGYCPDYEIRDFATISELQTQVSQELKKYDPNAYNLKISENHPVLFALNGKNCGEGIKIVVPTHNPELIEWGKKLSHCIGGYGMSVVKGTSFCFAIYSESTNEVLYTLEIQGKTMRQFRGLRNTPASNINERHYKSVVEFLTKENIIDKKNGVYI